MRYQNNAKTTSKWFTWHFQHCTDMDMIRTLYPIYKDDVANIFKQSLLKPKAVSLECSKHELFSKRILSIVTVLIPETIRYLIGLLYQQGCYAKVDINWSSDIKQ